MTDRERLLELAEAVMNMSHNGWSHGHGLPGECSLCHLVGLATKTLVGDNNSRPAEEVIDD